MLILQWFDVRSLVFAQFAKDFASFGAVVEAINHLDAEKLPPPLLRQLASLLPTEAEVRKLQRYRGTVSTLAPAEQFLWHLSCLPRCQEKVWRTHALCAS